MYHSITLGERSVVSVMFLFLCLFVFLFSQDVVLNVTTTPHRAILKHVSGFIPETACSGFIPETARNTQIHSVQTRD